MQVDHGTPYDELPYQCFPIAWTAPERLALASMLHGGPRQPLENYRVLELGCGNGANLLPLAYYRRGASFVGVDGAATQIAVATQRRERLGLTNIEFIHADFLSANRALTGQFDYIVAHGIFSWVPDNVREALFDLCASRLAAGGLLYLNYNTRPGWNVRGMVREFLLAQTESSGSLSARAQHAQQAAARLVSSMNADGHPYSQLMTNEFQFVCDSDVSYVAHEYLAEDNRAYWRSEFLTMARSRGLIYVADADFNCISGRIPDDFERRLVDERMTGRSIEDTVDLLCYRQLHTPIFSNTPFERRALGVDDFSTFHIASCLTRCATTDSGNAMFQHPSGYQVEVREAVVRTVLEKLFAIWPRGLPVAAAFPDIEPLMDDLVLLHRHGLIELRCIDFNTLDADPNVLNRLEAGWGGYVTTVYHTRELPPQRFHDDRHQQSRLPDPVNAEMALACGR